MPSTNSMEALRSWIFSFGGRVPGLLSREIMSRGPLLREITGDGATRRRHLHLTFDDGPTENHTSEIAELLSAYDARATFFVNTSKLADHEGVLERLVDNGHEIGTHGHTHIDAWGASALQTIADVERSLEELADRGVAPRWFRPPHGHVRPCHLGVAKKNGLRVALWDVMPCDFVRGSTAETVFYNTVRLTRSGSVVVLHDNESVASTRVTADAIRRILQYYTEQGWRFQTLSGW